MEKSQADPINDIDFACLLPMAVVRRTSVSSEGMYRLRFDHTMAAAEEYLNLSTQGREQASEICSILEALIGTTPSGDLRNQWMALRRDLYNDRIPAPAAQRAWKEAGPSGQTSLLDKWLELRRSREDLITSGAAHLLQEYEAGRRRLRRLFANLNFRRALSLASSDLSYELKQYIDAPPGASIRRIRRIERSLIRYYTRCVFKLTPFSAFIRTGLAYLDEDVGPPRKKAPRRLKAIAKLNKSLIGQLCGCIASHPELGPRLPLAITGSLTPIDGSALLLKRQDSPDATPVRIRAPREAILTIPAGPGVDWITAFLRSHDGNVTSDDLTAALAQATGNQVRGNEYVQKLVELGVLVKKVPVPIDGSPGLASLAAYLEQDGSPAAAVVRESLLRLESLAGVLGSSTVAERPRILSEMTTLASAAFAPLWKGASPNWERQMVYEDCIESDVSGQTVPRSFGPVLTDLKEFLNCCGALLDNNLFYRTSMDHLLRRDFGGGPVPLMRFVQRWMQSLASQWDQPRDPLSEEELNPMALPVLSQLLQLRAEIAESIAGGSENADVDLQVISKQRCWRKRFQQLRLATGGPEICVFSCYCQPVSLPDGGAAAVLNTLAPGPARILVHYLTNLEDPSTRSDIVQKLRTWLDHMAPSAELSQLSADFDFNANLAPRVTDRVINYADDITLPSGWKIDFGELTVGLDSGNRMRLFAGGHVRPVLPLDLGMMAASLQPALYRMLVCLGGTPDIHVRPFEPSAWFPDDVEKTAIRRGGRLQFGRCILRRRSWGIRKELLPRRAPNDSQFQHLLRVLQWQRELGLPDEVFMRSTSLTQWFDESKDKHDRQFWNRRKPQYMNFRNPFLADVLDKSIEESSTRLWIEEMLPGRDDLRRLNLSRPTELVLDLQARYREEDDGHGVA